MFTLDNQLDLKSIVPLKPFIENLRQYNIDLLLITNENEKTLLYKLLK